MLLHHDKNAQEPTSVQGFGQVNHGCFNFSGSFTLKSKAFIEFGSPNHWGQPLLQKGGEVCFTLTIKHLWNLFIFSQSYMAYDKNTPHHCMKENDNGKEMREKNSSSIALSLRCMVYWRTFLFCFHLDVLSF